MFPGADSKDKNYINLKQFFQKSQYVRKMFLSNLRIKAGHFYYQNPFLSLKFEGCSVFLK
jgi:hypothetical protein